MANDISNAEEAAGFVYDQETDRVVRPIRPGIRLARVTQPNGDPQYPIQRQGRNQTDSVEMPIRWITTNPGIALVAPDSAVRWAMTLGADLEPEMPTFIPTEF